MQPYHYYSHIGRGTGMYGDAIETKHKYGIAFTVEMDHAMISDRASRFRRDGIGQRICGIRSGGGATGRGHPVDGIRGKGAH